MSSLFRFKKVRTWLTLWLLALALLPLTISSIVIYFQRVEVIQQQRIIKLTTIRDLKVEQINSWLDEREGDLRVLSKDQEIEHITEVRNKTRHTVEDQQYVATARGLLQRYIISYSQYSELFIIDAKNGKVILSTDQQYEGDSRKKDPYFTEPLRSGNFFIKDIYDSKVLNAPAMAFSIPIFDPEKESHISAILVARVDLKKSIYKLLLDRTGMGKTGETMIVNKEGLALNELRGYEDAPLKLRINDNSASLAVQGHKGVAEVTDYRGEKVLAAYMHIQKTGWGFVAKQDVTEVYASVQEMLFKFLIIFTISTMMVIFCSFYIGKRISIPILEMKDVSTRLQEGDLAARNAIDRKDEFGFLARAINEMADSIESQMAIQKDSNVIIETLVASKELRNAAHALLKNLMAITDSRLAAFYLLNDDGQTFEALTAIGADADALQSFDAESMEGELGVALASKEIEHITRIPEDTRFTFKAVAGQALPREIVTIPLLDRTEVKAIVSLANLKGYSYESLKVIQMCWLPMSTALTNILAGEKTQQLASELAEKNEELQANAEELQSQTEELRATAAELEAQRLQVEDADRLKSEFLSNMSHELRTPLNSVLALSQLMISRGTGKDPDEEKSFLEVIERNGRQLLNLINDILDLSKIESGRMDILPAVFNSRLAVNRALDTVRPLAEEKGLNIEVSIDAAPEMESDEDKVNQILLNLLSNAVKFTEQGKITMEVTTTSQMVSFVVRDTGIGILPQDLPHIFDEFRQVDGSVTRRHEGTGLGLAICQKLATLVGGKISVDSTIGQGSTFTLELPLRLLATSNIAAIDSPTKTLPNAGATGRSLRRTILVIDDEQEVRDLVGRHLTEAGYQVALAVNGREGLHMARELRPFAITLDVLMPDMDGLEVLKDLKADPDTAGIPVIMLTVIEDRATGMALGAAGYLTKPVDKNTLCTEIEKVGYKGDVKRIRDKACPDRPLILVVEDNETAALQVQTVLEENGYAVIVASDGEEALASVQKMVPNGVVLDLMMPGIDGFQVLETIRTMPWTEELPVLVLTAKDLTAKDRARLKHHYIKQLIQKGSVNREELVAAVRSLIAPPGVQPEDAVDKPQTKKQSRLKPKQGGSRTVLVAEDNPDNMFTVTSALAEVDCRIVTAENGELAVEMAAKERPGLILMDMQLPEMSGMEATRRIKSDPALAGIPIVALTASAMKGDREKTLAAGCDDYISKPFDPTELQDMVCKWLG
jgi:CheY-like chemotaxis protein/HAMP domain-containing protein/prefoldin subunit 5